MPNGLKSLNIHRKVEMTVEEVVEKLSLNQKRHTVFILLSIICIIIIYWP